MFSGSEANKNPPSSSSVLDCVKKIMQFNGYQCSEFLKQYLGLNTLILVSINTNLLRKLREVVN